MYTGTHVHFLHGKWFFNCRSKNRNKIFFSKQQWNQNEMDALNWCCCGCYFYLRMLRKKVFDAINESTDNAMIEFQTVFDAMFNRECMYSQCGTWYWNSLGKAAAVNIDRLMPYCESVQTTMCDCWVFDKVATCVWVQALNGHIITFSNCYF